MVRPAVLVALLLAAPYGAASGTLDVGAVVLMLDNGQEADCVEDTTGLCLAALHGDSLGEYQLNAYERVSLVGAAVNRTYVNELAGFDLLPDGSMRLTPSDYEVEHPVFRVLIDVVGVRRAPGPLEAFAIGFEEDEWGFSYYGPGLGPLNTTLAPHGSWNGYGNESAQEGLLERDRIRPSQDLNYTSTDMYAESVRRFANNNVCPPVENQSCGGFANETIDGYRAKTPNVVVGAAFVQAAIATNPASLPSSDELGGRVQPGLPLGGRSSVAAPQALPSIGPTSHPLPLDGASSDSLPSRGEPRPIPPGPVQFRSNAQQTAPPLTGGLAPVVVAAVALALAVILAALYSRVTKSNETLLRERRGEIIELLKTRGPSTLADVARALGIDRSTIDYHARILVRGHRLAVYRRGGFVVLALPG